MQHARSRSSTNVTSDSTRLNNKSTSFTPGSQSTRQSREVSPDPSRKSASFHHGGKKSSYTRRRTESDCPSSLPPKSKSSHPQMRRHTESEADQFDDHPMPSKFSSFHHENQTSQRSRRRTETDTARPPRSASFQDAQPKRDFTQRPNSSDDLPSNCSNSSKSNDSRRRSSPDSPHSSRAPPKLSSSARKLSSFHDPLKSSAIIKDEIQRALFDFLDSQTEERSLNDVIRDWAYEVDGKQLRPPQMLLFEAPILLPPNNPLVEHHEYFDKWKTLHRDAFQDDDGQEDELIHKVARRCKIFLHPDKWPSDLSDDQKFLLQSMWDTFCESELF